MKKILFVVLIGLAVLAIGGVVRSHFLPGSHQHQGHKDIWYCPMHPNYTSDKPGSCPICGMTLVKRDDSQHQENNENEHKTAVDVAGYSPVHIDSFKQQLMGVRITKVVKKPIVKTIRAAGYVAHDFELYEAQLAYIDAWHQYYAFRSRRPVKDEYRQDWREYYMNNSGRWTSEDLRKAQEKLVKAEYDLRHMGLTDDELANLRKVKYGQPWVQPDLLYFGKNHTYWVYAEIFESDLGFIDVGQKATVEVPAYGETLEGIVRSVAESVDPSTRTVRVRIELSKVNVDLKEGMYVNVLMPVELNDALVVPRDALMMTGTRAIAFIQTSEGDFSPQEVQTGWEGEGLIQVISGLKEGESVVSGANFLVDSESRLQAAIAGLPGEVPPPSEKVEDGTKTGGHSHGQ